MKCPMKFNNPCADADDRCEGNKCMWYVMVNERRGCAVAFSAVSINAHPEDVELRLENVEASV